MFQNPTLLPGETVIRHARATRYSWAWSSRWRVYLTNQHLIFNNLLLGEQAYPLAHIAQVSERQQFPFNAVCVEYDNGGQDCFTVFQPSAWVEAIVQAKTQATLLPYTTMPPSPQKASSSNWWLVGVAIGFISLCGCTVLVSLLFLLLAQWPR